MDKSTHPPNYQYGQTVPLQVPGTLKNSPKHVRIPPHFPSLLKEMPPPHPSLLPLSHLLIYPLSWVREKLQNHSCLFYLGCIEPGLSWEQHNG